MMLLFFRPVVANPILYGNQVAKDYNDMVTKETSNNNINI